MKLTRLSISNFQSFGQDSTEIHLADTTFLVGPNGSGKTAVLEALCRLFAFDPRLRRVERSDFHVPINETPESAPLERSLWIQAEFSFPEASDTSKDHPSIPPFFAHMRLEEEGENPRVLFRLDAKLYVAEDEIEEALSYVVRVDANGEPLSKRSVALTDRSNIHVHYLPARRDPSDHIAFTATSLIGRALRSANWGTVTSKVKDLARKISAVLADSEAVTSMTDNLTHRWQTLHSGLFFAHPEVTFHQSEVDVLLRHVSISFSPAHSVDTVDFSRLSDGEKSMLYVSLVISMQAIGRGVLDGSNDGFDVEKLKPAIFSIVAMEEPENSLAPHYLGRVVRALSALGQQEDAQSLITTHAPAILKRVAPEHVRYLRLHARRHTQVSHIILPAEQDEAYKYVREAVQAFPELYFSRMVVLGEGDSEEIVIPRLLRAKGLVQDIDSISVVPLGGRHVAHFWRLLFSLDIPFVTLLDLDLGRHQGGWGRVKNAIDQIKMHAPEHMKQAISHLGPIPTWNDHEHPLRTNWQDFRVALESIGVFFSFPLDLDFAMLTQFPTNYDSSSGSHRNRTPDQTIIAVLGRGFHGRDQYSAAEQNRFTAYHNRFKLGSKPVAHLTALSQLDDLQLRRRMPAEIRRLIAAVETRLRESPE